LIYRREAIENLHPYPLAAPSRRQKAPANFRGLKIYRYAID
jgi:hypothetical protein